MFEIADSSHIITSVDRTFIFFLMVFMIVGGYQLYFLPQRVQFRKGRSFETRWDALIKYDPRWVWVYSGLYYPAILLIGFVVPSWVQLIYLIMNGIALLSLHCVFFFLLPVEVPSHWRRHNDSGLSQRALNFVQGIDQRCNSFPSMHVALATLVDLYIHKFVPEVYPLGMLVPILIAISALKTKQHFVVDILPGVVTGYSMFMLWEYLFTYV